MKSGFASDDCDDDSDDDNDGDDDDDDRDDDDDDIGEGEFLKEKLEKKIRIAGKNVYLTLKKKKIPI